MVIKELNSVAVEYSITELGRTLQVPFVAVYRWAVHHLDHIEEAQMQGPSPDQVTPDRLQAAMPTTCDREAPMVNYR